MVKSISKNPNKMKKIFKNVPENKTRREWKNNWYCWIGLNSKKQLGLGLKILRPSQMLSRLPITLAQSKVGNNSEKPTDEIRQLLYSLYRSKKLTKQLYKSLVDII